MVVVVVVVVVVVFVVVVVDIVFIVVFHAGVLRSEVRKFVKEPRILRKNKQIEKK